MACLPDFDHYFPTLPGTIPVPAAPCSCNASLLFRRTRVGVTTQAS